MKKIVILAVLAASCGFASAVTTTLTSSLQGTDALSGESAYSWGIPVALAPGQTITSASLSFSNIKLTAANSSGKGILYSDLIKSSVVGTHTYNDGDAAGDYFAALPAANIVSLGSKVFASVGTTLSWVVNFSPSQLASLNSFLTSGVFNIGFDPDCHYNVGAICFTYTTTTVNTPDAATTVYVLGLVLLGLEAARRKFAVAKK
ncbi:MAG TPA: hypothetical protein VG347_16825 [Verrucomicrobiae bacterium]|nr:hypothetical protein [Verrucomicrobiae bacterium]